MTTEENINLSAGFIGPNDPFMTPFKPGAHVQGIEREAALFAVERHGAIRHMRKKSSDPYIVHPAEVAELVRLVTDDVVSLAAAWLHDTVEDTTTTIEEIEGRFGVDIARTVAGLTDVAKPEDGNRKQRIVINRAHTAEGDTRVHTVKVADMISNTRSIAATDIDFAVIYLPEKAEVMKLTSRADSRLLEMAQIEMARGMVAVDAYLAQKALARAQRDAEAHRDQQARHEAYLRRTGQLT